MCDRTQDFLRLVQDASLAADISAPSKKSKAANAAKSKSAFNEAAADIAKGVHKTSQLLTKLTNLVRKQGLFDDPTDEINNLIFRIKQDLDELNTKCDTAQQFIDSQKSYFSDVNQASQHNLKVVSNLKSDLMATTKDFKTVLELRSSKMKDQQQRKVELIGKGLLSPMANISISSSSSSSSSSAVTQYNQQLGMTQRTNNNHNNNNNNNNNMALKALPSPYSQHSALTMKDPYQAVDQDQEGSRPQQQEEMQMLLEPINNTHYYDMREQAVSEVEKTIGELGTLFKRLATMIAQQQELVERIDEDVETAVENTENAKNALLKAYESVSSNRGMYLKIGALLAAFILFFVLFLM
jgi:syntaxin 5